MTAQLYNNNKTVSINILSFHCNMVLFSPFIVKDQIILHFVLWLVWNKITFGRWEGEGHGIQITTYMGWQHYHYISLYSIPFSEHMLYPCFIQGTFQDILVYDETIFNNLWIHLENIMLRLFVCDICITDFVYIHVYSQTICWKRIWME